MYKRKIVVDDKAITAGAGLTLRQSIIPCVLGMYIMVMVEAHLILKYSHHPILPLGICLRPARCLELSFPDRAQHHSL